MAEGETVAEAEVEAVKLNLPKDILEEPIAPIAFQTGQDVVKTLDYEYRPQWGEASVQVIKREERLRKEIEKSLLPAKGENPEESWQKQWMTTFKIFYDLGVSKAKGEDDHSRGAEEKRFAARALQAFLIESDNPKLRVDKCSTLKEAQAGQLREVCRFALAAAALDAEDGKVPSGSEALLDTYQRVFFNKKNVFVAMGEDRKIVKEDQRRFHIRNV